MKKTPFLILLVLLLSVGGAIFAWTNDDPADDAAGDAEMWLEKGPEDGSANDPGSLVGDATEVEAETPDDPVLEGLEEIARKEITGEAGKVRYLVVQVWKGKKGVPAAGAEVFFFDDQGPARGRGGRGRGDGGVRGVRGFRSFRGGRMRQPGDPFAEHWSTLAESRGQRHKTDVNGRVQLPPVKGLAIVTAKDTASYGFLRVGRRHKKLETILLQPDETVTVRVVDSGGRPAANVPVGVVQTVPVRRNLQSFRQLQGQMNRLAQQADMLKRQIEGNPSGGGRARRMRQIRSQQEQLKRAMVRMKGDTGRNRPTRRPRRPAPARNLPATGSAETRPELRVRRRTDDKGIAVFRHFQLYRRVQQKWWPPEQVDRFEAVLLMPLQPSPTRAFAGRPVPKDTLELRMPPTGSLALRTVDLEGRPFIHPVHADLRLQGQQVSPWTRMMLRKDHDKSEIVFPFVGLGLRFVARCRLDDRDFSWNVPMFAGPIQAGERLTVDVVVAPTEGMLAGRLLDKDGKPLANLRPTFLITSSAGRLEGENLITGSDGRFHMTHDVRDHHRPPFRLEIRQTNVTPVAGIAFDLLGLPRGRVTNLGDLRLDAFDAIATGLVTDDRGQPIPGATVQLQRERNVGGKQPRQAYVDEAFAVGRSDKKGRYSLFGDVQPGRYRLRVQARNHFPFETTGLRLGAEVHLKLLRNSRVVGTLLTPPWLRSNRLRVVLESTLDTKQRREDRVRDNRGKKRIYFDRVKPGSYSVLLRLQDFPDPILRIDGLEIRPGQQDVHPRLSDLDIGALVHRFQISAVDGRGQPIQPNWPLLAQIVRPGGKTSYVGLKWQRHNLEVVSASPRLEVWPFASGYRADRTVLGAGKSQLSFLKLPPVELQLTGLRGLVGKRPVQVSMSLLGATGLPQRLETWDRNSGRMSGWFTRLQRPVTRPLGAGDSVQLPLMRDGRYRVTAHLRARTKGVRPVAVQLGAVDVRLVPGAGPHRVTVSVDAKKVRKALADLAQREAAKAGQKKRP